jgi:hypothetical protein
MSTVSIQSGGKDWRFSPLPAALDAAQLQIVAQATILDDISLLVPGTPVEVASDGSFPVTVGPDGLVGLIGRPLLCAPPTQIAGTPVALTVTAPGYQALSLNGALPSQPSLPNVFQLLDFGQRRLIRAATTIQGRVFSRVAGVFQPVAGAIVSIAAATPAPALAGALPLPISVAGLVGLTATTNANAEYRFPPLQRFSTLTMQVTAPVLAPAVVIVAPLGGSNVTHDFRL